MQFHDKKQYSTLDYFVLEELSENKNELFKGEIYAMSGASINHNRITGNLFSKLNSDLFNKDCEVFMSDMRIWIQKKELFTYPDIMVVCATPEFYPQRDDTILNPLIIIEVLSKSTRNYDRGDKFQLYCSLNSFAEYILIDQYAVYIEQFSIDGKQNKWTLARYDNIDDVLKFHKIDFQIPLSELYNKVHFQEHD